MTSFFREYNTHLAVAFAASSVTFVVPEFWQRCHNQSQSGYDPSPSLDTGEIGHIVINCEVRVGDTATLKKHRELTHVA
ncbi:hypothetical protein GWK78_03900 [Candidatus Saccharibacteria bacterium oral taxon 488]|nr:hypothetical protein GWK78_03900 [Candidatus Saccharibacteria bacterium oral taxon 488]